MTDSDLIARALATQAGWLALGNERFEAHGATFIRNRRTPRRHDVNGVVLVRTDGPSEVEAILSRVETEYASMAHHRFEVDPLTPPALAARLALEDGYKPNELVTLVLEGELNATPQDYEIRPVVSEDDWKAYLRLDERWWRESSTDYFGPYDPELHAELSLSFRAKIPPASAWLARVDGVDCAFLSCWEGENGIAILEDLYTDAAFRRRGVATALIAHCVAYVRSRGAGPVVITAGPDDTPKHMYATLGFRPLFVSRSYTKKLA